MRKFILATLMLLVAMSVNALTVDNLRVQQLENPSGIDTYAPTFAWKLHSNERGVMQTAYKITVKDADGNVVYGGDFVDSDESAYASVNISNLQPSTRYYWTVAVKDNKGNEATSTEKAWFDTGLLGTGWGDAKWIKASSGSYGTTSSDVKNYRIEAVCMVDELATGPIFAASTKNTFYMWQVQIYNNTPKLRPHRWSNGSASVLAEVSIPSSLGLAIGKAFNLRIDVTGNGTVATTYINDVQIDSRSGSFAYAGLGFRSSYEYNMIETSSYDSYKVTNTDNGEVLHDYDFTGTSTPFSNSSLSNGWLKLVGIYGSDVYSWLDESSSSESMPYFRKEFTVDKAVKSAYLYTTALGVYDLYMNGQRVGHVLADGSTVYDEMKPGSAEYTKHVYYQQHEVSNLIKQGSNAFGAVVTPGWWSGAIAQSRYGTGEAFLGKLVINYTDGTSQTVVTDLTWAASLKGALLSGDIYDGEVYDARNESDWSSAGVDLSTWNAVAVDNQFAGVIKANEGQQVRALNNLKMSPKTTTIYKGSSNNMISVISTTEGAGTISLKGGQTAVVDFGQNFAGFVTFTVKGYAGVKMHLRFGEMLNDTGESSRGNDGPGGSVYTANLRTAKAELYYTLAGKSDGESYRPATTFWGFRYVEITATGDVEITKIEGLPISSSYIDAGEVSTSSSVVNQLFSNIVWGQRSNLLSIPTDCPQRDERQGWTADTQVYAKTGMFNGDVAAFYKKWLEILQDGQRSDGAYYSCAPVAYGTCGQSAWADAGIVMPWFVYQMTGDVSILESSYDSMVKYMSWLGTQSSSSYTYEGAGTAYGDWLAFTTTDARYVSVAYYALDAKVMNKIATILYEKTGQRKYSNGKTAYNNLFNFIRDEYQTRYCVSTGGALKAPTQTAYALMLNFGLYTDNAQKNIASAELASLISENNETLNTGFVGTAVLNQTLSAFGLNGKAYNLLLQRNCPSWLYSVDQGATTMWERWNSYTLASGFGNVAMNSFNHYAYGAVGEWMYRYMAGIDLDEEQPGFKHIILKPYNDTRRSRPSGQEEITWADATHESLYGQIRSRWEGGSRVLSQYVCEVPVNTTATLYLPVTSEDEVIKEHDVDAANAEGVTYVGYEDGYKVYNLGSGKYAFGFNGASGVADVEKKSTSFSISPNPARSVVNVISTDAITNVEIYSISGGLMQKVEGADVKQVNVENLPAGTYVVRATGADAVHTSRLLKQ